LYLFFVEHFVYYFYLQGSQAAIRNLNSKINKLDTDSLKQQEIIYNQVNHAHK